MSTHPASGTLNSIANFGLFALGKCWLSTRVTGFAGMLSFFSLNVGVIERRVAEMLQRLLRALVEVE